MNYWIGYVVPPALPTCDAPHPKLPDRWCCRAKHHTGSCVFTPRAR